MDVILVKTITLYCHQLIVSQAPITLCTFDGLKQWFLFPCTILRETSKQFMRWKYECGRMIRVQRYRTLFLVGLNDFSAEISSVRLPIMSLDWNLTL